MLCWLTSSGQVIACEENKDWDGYLLGETTLRLLTPLHAPSASRRTAFWKERVDTYKYIHEEMEVKVKQRAEVDNLQTV